MKIVFFSFGILEQGGGFENFLVSTVAGVKKKYPKLDITIVTTSDRLTKKLQSMLTVYYIKKHDQESIYREDTQVILDKLGDVEYKKVDSIKALGEELQHYDVVHTKNELLELVLLSYYGFKNLPPVITGIHTPVVYPYAPSFQSKLHNLLYIMLYKKTLKKLSSVYVQNQEDLKLIKDTIGFKNVKIINQALDIKPTETVTHDSPLFRILFVGRLSEQKGIDILLDCIDLLSKKSIFTKLEFKIAGTGDHKLIAKIEDITEQYPNVLFLGHIAHTDINELYDWTDITVTPSRYETLCKVAIEAGIAGKVAVVSDIPGPREVIVQNRTGFLVEPEADSFARKIEELYKLKQEDPTAFYTIGKKAQKHLTKTFNPAKAFEDLVKLLKEAHAKN